LCRGEAKADICDSQESQNPRGPATGDSTILATDPVLSEDPTCPALRSGRSGPPAGPEQRGADHTARIRGMDTCSPQAAGNTGCSAKRAQARRQGRRPPRDRAIINPGPGRRPRAGASGSTARRPRMSRPRLPPRSRNRPRPAKLAPQRMGSCDCTAARAARGAGANSRSGRVTAAPGAIGSADTRS